MCALQLSVGFPNEFFSLYFHKGKFKMKISSTNQTANLPLFHLSSHWLRVTPASGMVIFIPLYAEYKTETPVIFGGTPSTWIADVAL